MSKSAKASQIPSRESSYPHHDSPPAQLRDQPANRDELLKVLDMHFSEASPHETVKQVQRGFPLKRFEILRNALGMPSEQLAAKVGMSKATFHRRQQEGKLTSDESDKVMRYGRLLVKAISVFESEDAARQWLSAPQYGLGGAVPLNYAETEVGAREVENLLGRIDYGVYS